MGPLPQLYRYLVAGVVMVLALAGGVWLAGYLALPLGGLGVGLASGAVLAYLLTHGPASAGGRPTRSPRRR